MIILKKKLLNNGKDFYLFFDIICSFIYFSYFYSVVSLISVWVEIQNVLIRNTYLKELIIGFIEKEYSLTQPQIVLEIMSKLTVCIYFFIFLLLFLFIFFY